MFGEIPGYFAHQLVKQVLIEAVMDIVSVPAHRPIKPVYVRQFVALVDKVKESQA